MQSNTWNFNLRLHCHASCTQKILADGKELNKVTSAQHLPPPAMISFKFLNAMQTCSRSFQLWPAVRKSELESRLEWLACFSSSLQLSYWGHITGRALRDTKLHNHSSAHRQTTEKIAVPTRQGQWLTFFATNQMWQRYLPPWATCSNEVDPKAEYLELLKRKAYLGSTRFSDRARSHLVARWICCHTRRQTLLRLRTATTEIGGQIWPLIHYQWHHPEQRGSDKAGWRWGTACRSRGSASWSRRSTCQSRWSASWSRGSARGEWRFTPRRASGKGSGRSSSVCLFWWADGGRKWTLWTSDGSTKGTHGRRRWLHHVLNLTTCS